jgi:hypothetical protein
MRSSVEEAKARAELRQALMTEMTSLQEEVRTAQSGESARAMAGILVPVLAAWVSSASRGPLLVLAPMVMGFLATYQINVSAHEQCLAIYRDRLGGLLNRAMDFEVYNEQTLHQVRKDNLGTLAASLIVGVSGAGILAWGITINIFPLNDFGLLGILQIVSTLVTFTAPALALASKRSTQLATAQRMDDVLRVLPGPAGQQPSTP